MPRSSPLLNGHRRATLLFSETTNEAANFLPSTPVAQRRNRGYCCRTAWCRQSEMAADGRSGLMVRGTESVNLSRLNLTRPTDPLTPITRGTKLFGGPKISRTVPGLPPSLARAHGGAS